MKILLMHQTVDVYFLVRSIAQFQIPAANDMFAETLVDAIDTGIDFCSDFPLTFLLLKPRSESATYNTTNTGPMPNGEYQVHKSLIIS